VTRNRKELLKVMKKNKRLTELVASAG